MVSGVGSLCVAPVLVRGPRNERPREGAVPEAQKHITQTRTNKYNTTKPITTHPAQIRNDM